ncbi:hypothetical protein BGW80DRAFT_547458 [Lactifluus volemus]|nr:hypothetical protein BGW80DRAFT_547458 [Lactifluus volemus]
MSSVCSPMSISQGSRAAVDNNLMLFSFLLTRVVPAVDTADLVKIRSIGLETGFCISMAEPATTPSMLCKLSGRHPPPFLCHLTPCISI